MEVEPPGLELAPVASQATTLALAPATFLNLNRKEKTDIERPPAVPGVLTEGSESSPLSCVSQTWV